MKIYFAHILGFIAIHLIAILPSLAYIPNYQYSKLINGLPSDFTTHPSLILSTSKFFAITLLSIAVIIYLNSKLVAFTLKRVQTARYHLYANFGASLLVWSAFIHLNQTLFPDSLFNIQILNLIFSSTLSIALIMMAPIFLFLLLLLKKPIITLSSLVVVLSCSVDIEPQNPSKFSQPNIFLVGIDSLKPELINSQMPFLQSQLESSHIFKNTVTPFARTYPSWISILTGRHPSNSGANFNLISTSKLSGENIYLPQALQSLGYEAIYASDERRFSNINTSHGFQKIIGPKHGLGDFALSNNFDIPVFNLISTLSITKNLIPEVHANRAAFKTYIPSTFSSLVDQELDNLNPKKPLFLAIHYCLPHWPYRFSGHQNTPTYKINPAYPSNLIAADQQLSRLFEKLHSLGRLDNSIVFFLSDHGESWGDVDTGLKSHEGKNVIIHEYGHGRNILNPETHNVLLALKTKKVEVGSSYEQRSLIDIAPTIFELLGIESNKQSFDGNSLLTFPPHNRVFEFESGITFQGSIKSNSGINAVISEGIRKFTLTSNGELVVKDSALDEMLAAKQVGVSNSSYGIFYTKLDPATGSSLYLLDKKQSLIQPWHQQNIATTLKTQELKNVFCEKFGNYNPDLSSFCNKATTQNAMLE